MEQELRTLIGKYGFQALHEGLMREMRKQFDYLLTVFPPAKNDIVVPMTDDTIPEPITTPKHAPLDAIVGLKEIMLPAQATVTTNEEVHVTHILEEESQLEQSSDIKHVQVTAKGADKYVGAKASFGKEEQREAVQKKRSELDAKGIKPESLLTKENLENWINQGMSYQRIAREFVGVPDNEVSAIARSFGLQSQKTRHLFSQKKHTTQSS